MNNYIDLVLCRHAESGKPFLFRAPFCSGVEKGDNVIVETKRGESPAEVIAVQRTSVGDKEYSFAVLAAGATEPLKRVKKIVTYTTLVYEGEEE